MTDNPLANLGELSKPATTLVEKISDAVGGIFKPYQLVRVAKAEAEADRIRAESQIQVTDLHRRAMHRFLEEEAKRQSNMESITEGALPLLEDKSQPQDVATDWITNFFDKGRIISDEDMKQLWSRVLAGEANAPGSFSRKTVNLLADLDKRDAELFCSLFRYAWLLGTRTPLIFDEMQEAYTRNGITFGSLNHLESLGLIHVNSFTGYIRTGLPKHFRIEYFGTGVNVTMHGEKDNSLDVGHVLLTQAGHELARVCPATPIEGFFEYVCERWGPVASLARAAESE